VTPDEIRSRLEKLRKAGVALRRHPAVATLEALARVLDAWHDAVSPLRRELERELPAATGFSPAMVRMGLRCGLQEFRGDALRALAARELGGAPRLDAAGSEMVSGFETTAVLLAGQSPMPTLVALIAPLVLRSPVLAKASSRDPITPRLVARSIAEMDAELGDCVEVVEIPGDDEAGVGALLESDCVVATGSDSTVASVAARVAPPRRFVGYGHRVSVAALGQAATRGRALAEECEGLALDVALWDQLGCLSPVAVYVASPEAGAAGRVAEELADALARAEERWPRGEVDVAAAGRIAHERAEAELRCAAGRDVTLYAQEHFTVVREESAAARPAPLHRFVRVHPVGGPGELCAALHPLAAHLAGVALAGFGADTHGVARELADLGASRLCRPGRLQRPPLGWRHDNRGVLTPLARFTDLEPTG
jgi:hypothetical protein